MCYCTVCALFYPVFQGSFQVKAPGGFIRRGDLMEGLLGYEFERLILGGAYTWRGLLFGILRYANLCCSCGLGRRSCLGSLLFGSYCQ